jgi:sulfide:quinone oxidoreductase
MDDRPFSVLIAGGGVAALESALTLRELAGDLAAVELLAPEAVFSYRPVAVAEPFGLGTVRHFDLGVLAARAGAGLTLGALAGIDPERRLAETTTGATLPYDALLLACGAVPTDAVPGALTFRGPADSPRFGELLDELAHGDVAHVVFAVPWGATWPLPAYELALMTARRTASSADAPRVTVVTPEAEPLEVFGRAASEAVSDLLAELGVELLGGVYPVEHADGTLVLSNGSLAADRVVALPRLRGRRIDGIAQTSEGFVPVDDHCQALGAEAVFAAGDVTSFPIKQGGIAAQQAVVAAESIAVLAGATLVPHPFRPVLRGMLLTGAEPRYLRRDLSPGGESEWASAAPIWWPPTKIVGRRLSSFLADAADQPEGDVPDVALVDVDVELDAVTAPRWEAPPAAGDRPSGERVETVDAVMRRAPSIVGPDAALDAVAQMMRERDDGCVLVVDEGRLVGILTARDVLRAVAGGARTAEARANAWMTAAPLTAGPHTPLEAAAETMTEHGFHHLPVIEDERIVGLVGLRDVTRTWRTSARVTVGLGF